MKIFNNFEVQLASLNAAVTVSVPGLLSDRFVDSSVDGREHPDKNNQPQRHFRMCALIEVLFDPLIWDHRRYSSLLLRFCDFCREYKVRTKQQLETWRKLQSHCLNAGGSMTECECMNLYTSNLWNEIVAKSKAILHQKQRKQRERTKEDDAFLELLHFCVYGEREPQRLKEEEVNIKQLCEDLEWELLRGRNRSILKRDDMVSLFLRSNTLHLLVGLTQMEATCVSTRNCARRAIRCIVWSVDKKSKLLLKKSQIPFLPSINYCYQRFDDEASTKMKAELIHKKESNILVVGDGNLSFGRALSRLFGAPNTKTRLKRMASSSPSSTKRPSDYGARNIVVTCYESAMELLSRYPHSGSVVAEIMDRGGFVLYGVDATALHQTLTASFKTYGGDKRAFPLFLSAASMSAFKYDVIIWNFPHAMDNAFKPNINGELVENFMVSAKQILSKGGEIHVTLHINHQIDDEVGSAAAMSRTFQQYSTWKVGERAHQRGLRCVNHVELKHRAYPGYAIKNVQGNPFNIVKAETYVFKRAEDI